MSCSLRISQGCNHLEAWIRWESVVTSMMIGRLQGPASIFTPMGLFVGPPCSSWEQEGVLNREHHLLLIRYQKWHAIISVTFAVLPVRGQSINADHPREEPALVRTQQAVMPKSLCWNGVTFNIFCMVSGVGVDLVILNFLRVAKDQSQLGEGFLKKGYLWAIKKTTQNQSWVKTDSSVFCLSWLSKKLLQTKFQSFIHSISIKSLPLKSAFYDLSQLILRKIQQVH